MGVEMFVGQVAHHTQPQFWLPSLVAQGLRERREVHLQHVGLDHIELPMQTQAQGQVTVQFNNGKAPQALHQGLRQRGQAGPDLDHGLTGQRRNGLHDAVDDALVGQEMLSEALAGNVFHAIGSLMSSICRATACELCKGRDPDQRPPRKGRPAALAASPFPNRAAI